MLFNRLRRFHQKVNIEKGFLLNFLFVAIIKQFFAVDNLQEMLISSELIYKSEQQISIHFLDNVN